MDATLKLGYDVGERWSILAGYRTIEGGAGLQLRVAALRGRLRHLATLTHQTHLPVARLRRVGQRRPSPEHVLAHDLPDPRRLLEEGLCADSWKV